MDSAVFVATLPVSQFIYLHSTGSVATNTALSVATVATNKHFVYLMQNTKLHSHACQAVIIFSVFPPLYIYTEYINRI